VPGSGAAVHRAVAAKLNQANVPAVVRALLREAHAEVMERKRTASADGDEHEGSEPILVDYKQAARLLGTTVPALKSRVSRGDARLLAAIVSNGRSVRFNRAMLEKKFTPRGSR
jgi:hypothetical protein